MCRVIPSIAKRNGSAMPLWPAFLLFICREGANQSSRAFAVMYDLSGLGAGQVGRVREDRNRLRSGTNVTRDATYLHHHGKPLVAVGGVGFSDGREYSLRECLELVKALKSGGCSVMLGVPSFWRGQRRDALDDPLLHEVVKLADVISPWSVVRGGELIRDRGSIAAD